MVLSRFLFPGNEYAPGFVVDVQAIEGALKFARKYALVQAQKNGGGSWRGPLRGHEAAHELVAFTRAFHGRTMGALALTANPKYKDSFKPMLTGVHQAEYGNLESAAKLIKKGRTAAVFIEPVQVIIRLASLIIPLFYPVARSCVVT
jgi:acetylornithine/succinyldiaminopimelate/putrescine aminotransferase